MRTHTARGVFFHVETLPLFVCRNRPDTCRRAVRRSSGQLATGGRRRSGLSPESQRTDSAGDHRQSGTRAAPPADGTGGCASAARAGQERSGRARGGSSRLARRGRHVAHQTDRTDSRGAAAAGPVAAGGAAAGDPGDGLSTDRSPSVRGPRRAGDAGDRRFFGLEPQPLSGRGRDDLGDGDRLRLGVRATGRPDARNGAESDPRKRSPPAPRHQTHRLDAGAQQLGPSLPRRHGRRRVGGCGARCRRGRPHGPARVGKRHVVDGHVRSERQLSRRPWATGPTARRSTCC
jgi:hypothetical protein